MVRRAYFDDGTPLGSAQNDECQIDAIPQAWAVISGAADAERTRSAMDAVQQRLVRSGDKLIQLFDPPFDKGPSAGLHQRIRAGHPRERRPIHPRRWVGVAALQGRGDRAMELWNLINPVYHATTAEEVERYKVEPYVVCADVYGAPPHTGGGGRGTVRRVGFTASRLKRFWASNCGAALFGSSHASHRAGPDSN